METKINVAEILKYKPENMKLYSPLFGDVYLSYIQDSIINVKHHGGIAKFFDNGRYYNYPESEPLLFPSKEMRDWSKLAWKKGDVLVNSRGLKILFDRWANGNYTSFYAKTINLVEDGFLDTNLHTLASEEEAKSFIKCIEEKLGGKLNRETLKIEKAQPEFKDGDILIYKSEKFTYFSSIFILNTNRNEISSYVRFSIGKGSIDYDVPVYNLGTDRFRYATEEEKQQLFSALAKEGKAWDTEKKAIVNLESVVELKPFDKVLVRDDKEDQWSANIFSYQVRDMYHCLGESYWRYCIPYIGNEHLLGTTKDVEG